jgi:hypothetical protein
MNTTKINFHIYDTPSSVVVLDISSYNTDVTVTEAMLEVTPPNFVTCTAIDYIPGSIINITNLSLGWPICDVLPDGVWKFKMSVCPNDKVFKAENHLRTTNVRKCLYEKSATAIKNNDQNKSCHYLKLLQHLDVAQHLVKCEDTLEQGVIIFNYVISENKKIDCEIC